MHLRVAAQPSQATLFGYASLVFVEILVRFLILSHQEFTNIIVYDLDDLNLKMSLIFTRIE